MPAAGEDSAQAAKAFVPHSERGIQDHHASLALKFDLRNYVYDGMAQSLVGRMYQGQTTNFRTPGGGFAPVFTPPLLQESRGRAG